MIFHFLSDHIVIGSEVAKVIAEEDRKHPRWTVENRTELISAKMALEKARSDFEKEFANMPILTHAIHEMYKDLHLLVHTIDKEVKKLKLLATELATQQQAMIFYVFVNEMNNEINKNENKNKWNSN